MPVVARSRGASAPRGSCRRCASCRGNMARPHLALCEGCSTRYRSFESRMGCDHGVFSLLGRVCRHHSKTPNTDISMYMEYPIQTSHGKVTKPVTVLVTIRLCQISVLPVYCVPYRSCRPVMPHTIALLMRISPDQCLAPPGRRHEFVGQLLLFIATVTKSSRPVTTSHGSRFSHTMVVPCATGGTLESIPV